VLGTLIIWGLILALVALFVGVAVVQARRIRTQRVVLDDGVLSTSDGVSGRLNGLPVERIGTVVHLPARDRVRAGEGSQGIWTWGGILILDTEGRLVRRVTHIPGSTLPLAQIAEQIPAPRHVQLDARAGEPYRRRDFVNEFPHALRRFELRGALWNGCALVAAAFVGVPVLFLIGFFIWVSVTYYLQ
jgi:hypothetical protein